MCCLLLLNWSSVKLSNIIWYTKAELTHLVHFRLLVIPEIKMILIKGEDSSEQFISYVTELEFGQYWSGLLIYCLYFIYTVILYDKNLVSTNQGFFSLYNSSRITVFLGY